MKAFFTKIWSWVLANKIMAIVIASVLVVGTTCAIVLPIALGNDDTNETEQTDVGTDSNTDDATDNSTNDGTNSGTDDQNTACTHTYDNACDTSCNTCGATREITHNHADTLTAGDTTHWYACSVCGDKKDEVAHTYDNACDTSCNTCGATREITHSHGTTLIAGDTTHYYACSICGDKKDEVAHTFDKTVASSEYLKAEATATTKAQYYKSCVCGAASATEYFETDKLPANLQVSDISKTYDGTPVAEPTVTFDGVGAENFAYYKGDEKLTERPTDAGTYKVVVTVDETDTHAGDRVEREFTIAKVVVTIPTLEKAYDGYGEFEFVFDGPADEEIDCLVDIGQTNKNVGTYTDVAITYTSVSSENYEITATTVSATITPKVLTNISLGNITYKGSTDFAFVLSAPHGLVSGETFSLQVTAASKNVGNAVEIASISYTNNNYSIDKSAITLNIKPKDLDVSGVTFTKVYDGTDTITREFTSADGLVDGDTFSIIAKMPSADVGVGASSTSTVNLITLKNYTFNGQSMLDYVKAAKASAEITPKTITLPADKYTAEYTGSSRLTVDISEYAVAGDTLTMSFQPMRSVAPILPISAVGSYADVNFAKVSYSDTVNYTVTLPESGYSLEIVPKKISNLDLKVSLNTFIYGNIYLIAKDGVFAGEDLNLTLDGNYSGTATEGMVFKLQAFGALYGSDYEAVYSFGGADYSNYEFVTYEDENGNMIYGTVTIVANCDVQFDGSCNCGNNHLTETLTFPGGEAVGVSATISCDSTYEGGIYKIALEGGKYEFLGSDQFFNISGIYDENGNKVADSIGTHVLPEGTYYFHVYVGSIPSSDTIWVKKVANMLDSATMESAIVPDMYDDQPDQPECRKHNLGTHNGGDTFVLFYSTGEDRNVLGQSIYFFYDDGDEGWSAKSNIDSIEFYDVNGIQLNVTYEEEPDMSHPDGVTAVGGVYIVVTMNAEGMDNLYFYAY